MIYLVIGLLLLGVFAAITGLWTSHKKEEDEVVLPPSSSCATCTGADPKCEQECVMEAATKQIEYYDDEELDAFRGRASDSYSDEEVAQFSEVLYTMRPEEVKGWNRSLILRGINLPDQLKDEVIMMMDNPN